MKRAPCPGAESTVTEPACASTIRWTVASPSPVPSGLVVKNGVKSFSWSAGRDAGAVILDRQLGAASVPRPAGHPAPSRAPVPGSGAAGKAWAALSSRFQNTWRTWSGSPTAARRLQLPLQVDAVRGRIVLEGLERIGHQGGQVERLAARRGRPREGEELGHQVLQPPALAQHDVEEATVVRSEQRAPQQLHRAHHRGQRVAQLVGQAGGQLAQVGQPLRAGHALLHGAKLRQVLEDHGGPERRALAPQEREGGVAEPHPGLVRADHLGLAASRVDVEVAQPGLGLAAHQLAPARARASARRPG